MAATVGSTAREYRSQGQPARARSVQVAFVRQKLVHFRGARCALLGLDAIKLRSQLVKVFPLARMVAAVLAQHIGCGSSVAVDPVIEGMPDHLRIHGASANKERYGLEEIEDVVDVFSLL